jgi:hypothetical protein
MPFDALSRIAKEREKELSRKAGFVLWLIELTLKFFT